MKTIGLIAGMSWESSVEYYRLINEEVKARLGGLHSAKILMYSVDFAEVEYLQRTGAWEQATELMIGCARRLEQGGADCVLICTNTMHRMADEVQASLGIPLMHIADATATAIKNHGLERVGLLGTRFTMEGAFYRDRLAQRFGLQVIVPNETDRQRVHDVIYLELCLGRIEEPSKIALQAITQRLLEDGAQGVILGCTEIPLLLRQEDVDAPLFDTTRIHALAAVEFALS